MARLIIVLAAAIIAVGLYLLWFPSDRQEPLAVTVIPFYAFKGPQIHVGKYSTELMNSDPEQLLITTRRMKAEWSTLPVETMYVAAIRLFDAGKRDEALYWFYSAHYRATLFSTLIDPKDKTPENVVLTVFTNAHNRFYFLAVPDMQAHAGCDQGKWVSTLETVLAENRTLPEMAKIYPVMTFLPKPQWPSSNMQVAAQERLLLNYVKTRWDQFKTARDRDLFRRYCHQP